MFIEDEPFLTRRLLEATELHFRQHDGKIQQATCRGRHGQCLPPSLFTSRLLDDSKLYLREQQDGGVLQATCRGLDGERAQQALLT